MLRHTTLNQALTPASQLSVVAKSNSVLSELVGLSVPLFTIDIKDDNGLQEQFASIQASTQGNTTELSQHSLQQDALIKDLSGIVRSHINLAKNTVKPLVVEMADAITTYQNQFKPKLASEHFNIEALCLPEVLEDESFLDTLKPYLNKTVIRPELKVSLAVKTTEELMSLIATGVDRLDKLISTWLSQKDDDFLVNVFNSFFTTEKTLVSYDDLERLNIFHRIDYVLAMVLFCHKLYDNADASATVDLSTYNASIMQIRDYAGSLLTRELNSVVMFNRSERLIMDLSSDRYTVRVNGSVYKAWLQAGGQPEVILGYVISGDSGSSKVAIDAKAAEYTKQWDSYQLFYNTNESNKALDYFKSFLSQQLALSMKELTEMETEYSQKNPSFFETINTQATAYINGLRKDEMTNVFDIALILVAKCRFFYTSAYAILNDINEAAKANKDIDVREAALVAVINYLSDYFVNQMTVTHG